MKKKKSSSRYQEIESWLRELVSKGVPGELIPSEVELAGRFNVSRMTARYAVMNLLREGLVDRRRGAGTFIASHPLHRREGVLLSFTEDMKRRGLKPSSKLISVETQRPSKEDAQALQIPQTSEIIVIKRIRLADDVPLSIERVALIERCKAATEYDLELGSLHDALRNLGAVPTLAHGWLSARASSAKVERRVIEDQDGVLIEFTETAYAANRYVVDIKLNCAPVSVAAFRDAPIAPARIPS
jgi:GntR family transcriptional regulator